MKLSSSTCYRGELSSGCRSEGLPTATFQKQNININNHLEYVQWLVRLELIFPLDKMSIILEDTNTLIGLPPLLWPVSAPPPPPRRFIRRGFQAALFFVRVRAFGGRPRNVFFKDLPHGALYVPADFCNIPALCLGATQSRTHEHIFSKAT